MTDIVETEKVFQAAFDRIYLPYDATRLNALVIKSCNGDGSVPFSRATIKFHTSRYTEHLDCLNSLYDSKVNSEAKIRNILAIHYFKPLVYGSQCFVDKGGLDLCEFCKKKVDVDDTSLGHPQLWHGRADIVIKNSTVKIEKESDASGEPAAKQCEKESDASGEPAAKQRKLEEDLDSEYSSIIEVKLEKTMSLYAKEQALAEAIVNAFCEAKRDSSFFNRFIPSFLATEKFIRIILYNCKLDILLFSDPLNIWRETYEDEVKKVKLNVDTLLQIWLALNFDNFDMEVDKEILDRTHHSNFKTAVGENAYRLYLKGASKPCPFEPVEENLPIETDDDSMFVVAEIQKRHYFTLRTVMKQEG